MGNRIIVAVVLSILLISTMAISCTPPDWVLQLEGAILEEMDKSTFEEGARPNCHGSPWRDYNNRVWEGIPLWLLVGRVDDEEKHKIGAYNDELAFTGYEVQLINDDGRIVTLSSAGIMRNNNMLIAYQIDGEPLDKEFWPLRLVGTNLEEQQMLGKITKIKISFP